MSYFPTPRPATTHGFRATMAAIGMVIVAFVAFAETTCALAATDVRFVGDSVDISMRSGPEINFRIVRILKSGMKLRVLEKNGNGWSRVRDENDKEGWILDRYLTEKAPASLRVAELEQAVDTLRAERDTFEKKINELNQSNQSFLKDRTELERLRSLMQNTIKVDNENKQFKANLDTLNAELLRALDDKRLLERQSDTSLFISGATVLALGMIAGFIFARKRRSHYDSL